MLGETVMANPTRIPEPKRFIIPSSSYGITASEAAETLTRAEEIKANKELHKAASKHISQILIAARAAKLDAAKKAVG